MATANPGALSFIPDLSWQLWLFLLVVGLVGSAALFYALIYILAPIPRAPRPSEQTYRTTSASGSITAPEKLPCWHDTYFASTDNAFDKSKPTSKTPPHNAPVLESPELAVSLVIPAYNEEARLGIMLDEACSFLEDEYGAHNGPSDRTQQNQTKRRKQAPQSTTNGAPASPATPPTAKSGWEVLVVSDGSTDKTEDVAFGFARKYPGARIRVITLERNRGKGGAVVHGLRHIRGQYAVFADADGASKFSDLAALIRAADKVADDQGRAVAIGSRAHMVGTPAVVQRSAVRNFLMHSFHLLLWLMTPEETSKIGDTQCGFKLFTRASLPAIVPHMHSEGWIFDVEMLMLAEMAGVPMVEVPIGWKEVGGSKLNVVWDSLGMAYGLGLLRAAWGLGVFRI